MYEVRLKPLALIDLEEIWFYSYNKWSLEQADLYLDSLDNGISKFSQDPFNGKLISTIENGYFSFSVNHHTIFYYLEKNVVVIVRILHEMMDTSRHI